MLPNIVHYDQDEMRSMKYIASHILFGSSLRHVRVSPPFDNTCYGLWTHGVPHDMA